MKPQFVTLSAFFVLLGVIVTVSNSREIGRDLFRLYSVNALILGWAIILIATIAHEFAHGLTCTRFGGKVNEMGFMLIFFMPAMYCNVSDAWLFPEKSRRLWVTFAGAYFELFLWAVATLIWRVTDPHTFVNYAALIIMATSGIKSFFNLNPLIKLDGYYLLSDYLDIPNLRSRAVGYVSAGIKRLFGSSVEVKETTPRERRIYIVYGLLSLAYTIFILSFIAMRFGGFLMGRIQAFGFIIFMGLIMIMF